MGDKRRRFDPEFRAGAVRIVKETGKPVAQVARDLGISPYTLHNWVQADRAAAGDGGLNESEREELARLRKQKAELGPAACRGQGRVGEGTRGAGDGAQSSSDRWSFG